MSTSFQKTPRIVNLARRLESDIKQRELRPGDPYLSTTEAAKMLGVSTGAANRALQLLVKRDLLHRRQRSGTFIADPSEPVEVKAPEVDRVHMLVHRNFLKSEGLLADGVILGIQDKLPKSDIQFNFLPANEEGEYVGRILSELTKTSLKHAFVLVRAPLDVQRTIQSSSHPAVIYGTPFPSITKLPWIERDQYQGGRLAAARLIRNGFTNITVITREKTLPGDYRMLDGVRDEMFAAGISINAISWRPLPSDIEAVRCAVSDLLKRTESPPGFVCRSLPLAEGTVDAFSSQKLRLDIDAGVVLLDVYQTSAQKTLPFPSLATVMSPETMGQHIGQMVLSQLQGRKPSPDCEVIPLELREPRLTID